MVAKDGGYDALYVDMQHAPYSIETTATICTAALGIGITPLVRVPSHDAQWMSRVLDGGALGSQASTSLRVVLRENQIAWRPTPRQSDDQAPNVCFAST